MTADATWPAADITDEEMEVQLRDIFGTLDYLDGAPLGPDPVDTFRLASYAEFRTRICPAVLAAGTQTASRKAPPVAVLLAPTSGGERRDDGDRRSRPTTKQPAAASADATAAAGDRPARGQGSAAPEQRGRPAGVGLETPHGSPRRTGPARWLARGLAVAVLVGLGLVLGTAGAALVLLAGLYGT